MIKYKAIVNNIAKGEYFSQILALQRGKNAFTIQSVKNLPHKEDEGKKMKKRKTKWDDK